MLGVPPGLARLYDTRLEREGVAVEQRSHYRKWLRFYWDFCHKYAFEPTERQTFPAFHEKLRAKNQPEALCRQAEPVGWGEEGTPTLIPDRKMLGFVPHPNLRAVWP